MRPREINNGKFLINWINKEHGLDFEIDDSHKDQDSHIDVLIKSHELVESFGIQNVAFMEGDIFGKAEVTISDGEMVVFGPDLKSIMVLGVAMTDKEKEENVIKCIESKQNLYSEELTKNIILLVEVTIPFISPEELDKIFKTKKEFVFKGIYFVALPVILALADDKYQQSGYVYPVKDFL